MTSQEMVIGTDPVQALPAIVGVVPSLLAMKRIGPIQDAAFLEMSEDHVELVLAHQEWIVLEAWMCLSAVVIGTPGAKTSIVSSDGMVQPQARGPSNTREGRRDRTAAAVVGPIVQCQ